MQKNTLKSPDIARNVAFYLPYQPKFKDIFSI